MNELTQEQKDELNEVANKIIEAFKKIIEDIKKAVDKFFEHFNKYVSDLKPKNRYRFLKAIGIKNYIPFFRRDGTIHCRNNC
nr:hypothetical protein [uncultured Anaerocolumna sp.]